MAARKVSPGRNVSRSGVIRDVRRHIAEFWPEADLGVRLSVLQGDHDVRKDEDWWYVNVEPEKWPPQRFPMYEALARMEREFNEKAPYRIVLVPVR